MPYPGPSGEEGYALSQDASRPVAIADAKFSQEELAMVSLWGPSTETYIVKIDGIPTNVLRLTAPAPVWLKPGTHNFSIAWARLLTTGAHREMSVTVVGNHIYLPRMLMLNRKEQKVAFELVDHGTTFPRDCLPVALQKANKFDFSMPLYRACINRHGYSDPVTYIDISE